MDAAFWTTLLILSAPVVMTSIAVLVLFRGQRGRLRFAGVILLVSEWFALLPSFDLTYPALSGQDVTIPLLTYVGLFAFGVGFLFVAVFLLKSYKNPVVA